MHHKHPQLITRLFSHLSTDTEKACGWCPLSAHFWSGPLAKHILWSWDLNSGCRLEWSTSAEQGQIANWTYHTSAFYFFAPVAATWCRVCILSDQSWSWNWCDYIVENWWDTRSGMVGCCYHASQYVSVTFLGYILLCHLITTNDQCCLQCFDTVGWTAGRASVL